MTQALVVRVAEDAVSIRACWPVMRQTRPVVVEGPAASCSTGCAQLHLDSGVQRFGAHRFYLAHHMDITAHHFRLEL